MSGLFSPERDALASLTVANVTSCSWPSSIGNGACCYTKGMVVLTIYGVTSNFPIYPVRHIIGLSFYQTTDILHPPVVRPTLYGWLLLSLPTHTVARNLDHLGAFGATGLTQPQSDPVRQGEIRHACRGIPLLSN